MCLAKQAGKAWQQAAGPMDLADASPSELVFAAAPSLKGRGCSLTCHRGQAQGHAGGRGGGAQVRLGMQKERAARRSVTLIVCAMDLPA